MHALFYIQLFVAMLAGRALAFNISIGGGIINASEFLTISQPDITSACNTNCTPAINGINACTDANATCLCDTALVKQITQCEQCYFDQVVSKNIKHPSPLEGQASALTAYAASCAAVSVNLTVPTADIALSIAPGWDGPVGVHLNTAETVIAVIAGTLLAASCFTIVNTM